MAIIIPFPQKKGYSINQLQEQQQARICSGCHERIRGDHWSIRVPMAQNKVEQIALCDDCHKEVMQQGVFV